MWRFLPGLFGLIWLSVPGEAVAHGGGLNSEGCHNNRKTGDYHCHREPTEQYGVVRRGSGFMAAPGLGGPFHNCRAAWAAGEAPVRIGDEGYGPHLDGDGDGIGCERPPR